MKRSIRSLILIVLLTLTVILAVSCGGSVDKIAVSENGMPQLTYVLGEELDLSNGLLDVTDKDTVQQIAMNAEGVSTSGYDKNKLGEQKVTVSYGGQSVEITVTVVERMSISGAVTDYLMGEQLDVSKGSIKITRNDGTSYTVNMNNPKLSFEGFASEKAGNVNVEISYSTGSEVYSTTLGVKVHAVESVEFEKAPDKISYNSHEEGGLDITGGVLTVKGNGGALVKSVPLTEDMVSGFDISAVNGSNTPYTQKLTVTYGDHSFTYDVTLVYTDISMFKDNSAPFTALDWSAERLPEINDDLGELALDLMARYLELTKAQASYIGKSEALAVARAAFLYGMERLDDDLIALEDAFYLYMGELVFTCESYEAVEDAVAALADTDSDLYKVTPVLAGLLEEFAEEDFDGNAFGYYGVITVDEYKAIAGILEYTLGVYDKFESIPTNWRELGVEEYADAIDEAYAFMNGSAYYNAAYADIYHSVSSWRGGDDIFDMLYTYYYGIDDMEAVVDLAYIALPTALDELLSYVMAGMEKMTALVQYYDAIDTTEFLSYYYMALEISEEILASDDPMLKALYYNLPLNGLLGITEEEVMIYYFDTMIEYLEVGEGGVQYCAVSMFGTPEYHELLDKYMAIVLKLYRDESYSQTTEYATRVEDMFATYLALSPAQQYNFLSSLNPIYYGMYPELAFDAVVGEGEDYTCEFVRIIHEYYRGKFGSESAKEAYNAIVIALEIYAQRPTYEDWKTEFSAKVSSISDIYNAMTDADKAVFDKYFRSIYTDLEKLLVKHAVPGAAPSLGEWQDEFDALGAALSDAGEAYQLFSEGLTVYTSLFSAYEKVESIANYILEKAPANVIEAFYHSDVFEITYVDSYGFTSSIACSYDFALHYYRTAFVTALVTFTYADQALNIYSMYYELDMSEFMEKCYDVIWAFFDQTGYDREKTLAVIDAFSKLDIEQQVLFIMMESEGFYYRALEEFSAAAFTKAAAGVADKLFALEKNYIFYMYYPNSESLGYVETALEELKDAYEALDDIDKTSFEDLEELYAHYVSLVEALLAEQEA